MITKDSIAEAYSFFHQKWNLYQLIDKEPVKDHNEYTISSNAEAMNAELYEKMLEEQENFRGWLLGQPPEEILNHTYEYTIREDILMEMEYLELSFSQMQMLLSSPTPLADIFKEYNRQETSHMEEIRDCCISRADEVQKQAKECPLYLHDAAYADAHDEMESYIASLRINTACKNMIEDAIAAANVPNVSAATNEGVRRQGPPISICSIFL